MTLDVVIISKETIKPSSPTPLQFQSLNLSLLDQLALSAPICMILFYSPQEVPSEKPYDCLKKSLSQTLTHFYPFAGRISDNQLMNCNDEGVEFYETRVNAPLSQVINCDAAEELAQLVPTGNFSGPGARLLSIQANTFGCGGIAIGVSLSHKVGDASSLGVFLNSWASTARGAKDVIPNLPKFDTTSYFPPERESTFEPPVDGGGTTPKVFIVKRLVFDPQSVAALRAECSDKLCVEMPTRVEAVCARIWRSAMNAVTMRTGSTKSVSAANLAINLRGRMVPALPDSFIGNLGFGTLATSTMEVNVKLPFLVGQLRAEIKNINDDYVKRLQTPEGFRILLDSFMEVKKLISQGQGKLYTFTSWCRFPFYEADFGWGKPIWAAPAGIPFGNQIVLMDTKCGRGVEAWVALHEEDMVGFQSDPQLLAFTSNNPIAHKY